MGRTALIVLLLFAALLSGCGGSGAQHESSGASESGLRAAAGRGAERGEDPMEGKTQQPERAGKVQDEGGEGDAGGEAPIFTFLWKGGFAGFDRRLEIFGDRRAAAEDFRFGHKGEARLTEAAFDSILSAIRPLMTHSAGPFRSGITDDFHFTVQLQRADSLVIMAGDANGFPESFRPVFHELTELTGRILLPAEGKGKPK
jgi:hypothetical protein